MTYNLHFIYKLILDYFQFDQYNTPGYPVSTMIASTNALSLIKQGKIQVHSPQHFKMDIFI